MGSELSAGHPAAGPQTPVPRNIRAAPPRRGRDRPPSNYQTRAATHTEELVPAQAKNQTGDAAGKPLACGLALVKPTRARQVRTESATTFLVHARLLDLAGPPGAGWRRQGIKLAELWRAAVADTRAARAEISSKKISSVGHLWDVSRRVGGVGNVLSHRHRALARRADAMLVVLDDALRERNRQAERDAARRKAFEMGT